MNNLTGAKSAFCPADEVSAEPPRLEKKQPAELFAELPLAEDPRIVALRLEKNRLQRASNYLTTINKSLKYLIEIQYNKSKAKKELLAILEADLGLTKRHLCRLLNLARSTYWYKSNTKSNTISELHNEQIKILG